MYFSTITIAAVIATLAVQHVQAAPSPMPDLQVRELYEALGKPRFAPTPALRKRDCNCEGYIECRDGCSAFGGTPGTQISAGFCILSCADASDCNEEETSNCPSDDD